MTLGKEGIPEASQNAVLNANYMMNKLKDLYTMAYDEVCMHEFVMSLEDLKKKAGVSAMDIAKGLLDNGIHPPTMYFPLIVDEALMVEPTETESKETLDDAIAVFRKLYELAGTDPESLHQAPVTTPVTRMDEVEAARHPVLYKVYFSLIRKDLRRKVMVRKITYIESDQLNPYKILQWRSIYSSTVNKECILYLWQNQNTVVIGRNQNAWKECKVTKS